MSENKLSTQKTTVKSLLESENVKNRIEEILGKNAATFATSVIQIQQSNKMLVNADPQSIIGAALTSATLNLPLNNSLGYAYLIPFNERQKDGSYMIKAQFQIGYKGFHQLAMRSGQFKTIHATDVKEGEIESRDRLTGEMNFNFIENDDVREKTKTIGYISYFRLLNGFEAYHYMSSNEIEKHAKKFSQTYKKGYGLWKDDLYSMALKTVLKLLLSKKAPLSIDMQKAVETDQASFKNEDEFDYVDHKTIEVNPEDERILSLLNDVKDQDDLDFIKGLKESQTKEYLSIIEGIQIKFDKENK
jgi:recombination protein RecT